MAYMIVCLVLATGIGWPAAIHELAGPMPVLSIDKREWIMGHYMTISVPMPASV